MRSAALLLGVLALCVGPLVGRAAEVPATPDPADLPGIYECQGTGAEGAPYRGAVIIEPDGSRFVVRWIIASELTAVGVGFARATCSRSVSSALSLAASCSTESTVNGCWSLERAACRGTGVRGNTHSGGKPAGAFVNDSTASAAPTAFGYASVWIVASDQELTVQVGLSFASSRRRGASSTLRD